MFQATAFIGVVLLAGRRVLPWLLWQVSRTGSRELFTLAVATAAILYDDPTLRIVEQEQEKDCDLIAIGRRGEGNLEHLLPGSVTKHVLATSQGDVLVSV